MTSTDPGPSPYLLSHNPLQPNNPFPPAASVPVPEFDPPDTDVKLADLQTEAKAAWNLADRALGGAAGGRKAITSSATEFSELISTDISAAGNYNEQEWRKACMVLTFAASIADLWHKDVTAFRKERNDLISDYQSAIAAARLAHTPVLSPAAGGSGLPLTPPQPPMALPHDPHAGLRTAYMEVLARFNKKGKDLKSELLDTAGERAALLDGGPEPSNLKALVEAGVLGWGAYNVLGPERDTPLPVSTGEAKKMAKELEAYLSGDKEPDARYYEILAAVGAVSAKAKTLQQANKANMGPSHPMSAASSRQKLDEDELDFLRTFYGELEEQSPHGVVRLMPWLEGHDGPGWSETERNRFAGAMADGLLVLSDEDLGGGQDLLPESVQNFANGVPHVENDPRTGRSINDHSGNWLADARDFGLLLEHSDPELRGGTEFSANTTLSMGHHLANKNLDLHETYDTGMSAVLDVTTRNEEANHRILTDAHDHPMTLAANEYQARLPGMPDFGKNADALAGLYSYDWHDEGKAVSGLTDWIPEFSRGTSAQAEMAGTATLGLMETLAGDGDDKPFHDTGKQSDTKYELSVTEINPELTESLTKIYLTYQEDLTLDSETKASNGYATITSGEGSLLLHNPLDKALFVDADTQKGFIQLLVADNKNAGIITSSVESLERKIIDVALDSPNNPAARHAGANVGAMRTIVHDAMIDEYVDRVDNRQEAKNQAADNWQTGFNITVAISNGALGSVPVAGPVLAPTAETLLRLYEHPGKADFLEEWEHKNQGDEERPKEIIDYGPRSVQHAQLQLLDVMVSRGAVKPEELVEKGLLPSNFDAEKDAVVPSVRENMGGRNLTGGYSNLMEILEAAGKNEANRDSGENPVPDFFEGVRDHYVPDSKQDKGE